MVKKASESPATAPRLEEPTPPRVGALTTVNRVRKELAAVYRDARQGIIAAGIGTKLSYILSQLAQLIETSDIEKRLEELEHRLNLNERK